MYCNFFSVLTLPVINLDFAFSVFNYLFIFLELDKLSCFQHEYLFGPHIETSNENLSNARPDTTITSRLGLANTTVKNLCTVQQVPV